MITASGSGTTISSRESSGNTSSRRSARTRSPAFICAPQDGSSRHDFIEEAIEPCNRERRLAACGRRAGAGQRRALVDREEWHRIARCLELLPEQAVKCAPELLILHARSSDKRGRYGECLQSLDRAEESLDRSMNGSADHSAIRGEILAVRSVFAYHGGDGRGALELAWRALELLPREAMSERAYAELSLGVSLQMTGDLPGAFEAIYEAIERSAASHPTHRARLLQTLCFMHWIAADPAACRQVAGTMREFGRANELLETIVYANYFLGARDINSTTSKRPKRP